MTNSIALALGLSVAAALGVDFFLYGSDHLVFIAKKLFDMTEWMAFWR